MFLTDAATNGHKILVYPEYAKKQYYLPNWATNDYPVEPYDVFRWFMPPMRDWITQFFNTIVAKMHEKGDNMEVVSPSVNGETETLYPEST